MGIFRYFYWHFQTHPESITQLDYPQSVDGFDILGLDLNAIFHPACQSYWFEKEPMTKLKRSRVRKTMEGCYRHICLEIEKLIEMVTPTEELIMAIDGVAGLSKMNQQRQRRFRSAKEKTEDERAIFDSTQISTGTSFLSNLTVYMRSHFTAKKYPFKITFMDETQIGEGEHKLVRYLERVQKKRICIYSPDADLIMLGIGLNKKNIFIFRPNIYSNIRCSHFLVSLDVFRRQLIDMIDPTRLFPERETGLIDDFVFLLFFLGNDFLPHSPSFEIKFKGIDRIVEIYAGLFHQGIHLVTSRPTYTLNTNGVLQMVSALAKEEIKMIEYKKKGFRGFPDRLVTKYGPRLATEFDAYRSEYYQVHFPNETVTDVCRDYMVGLLFVGAYYYQGMPDYMYQYPHFHGPFFHELEVYLGTVKTRDIRIDFIANEPVSPLLQLLCVLPRPCRKWLPECLHTCYDQELKDLYPSEFEIDMDGCVNDYEGLVKIPMIDIKRITEVFDKAKPHFTAEEKKRNTHHH